MNMAIWSSTSNKLQPSSTHRSKELVIHYVTDSCRHTSKTAILTRRNADSTDPLKNVESQKILDGNGAWETWLCFNTGRYGQYPNWCPWNKWGWWSATGFSVDPILDKPKNYVFFCVCKLCSLYIPYNVCSSLGMRGVSSAHYEISICPLAVKRT